MSDGTGVRLELLGENGDGDDGVARLLLDRPPLHVLDIATIEALDQALARVESSTATVLVLGSTGDRAFSAGVDIKDHTPDKIERMLTGFHGVFRRLHASRLVSIAAVRGACLGGGMELALACDIVVTERSSKWGLPEIKLACFPPVGLSVLARRFGPRIAEMCLTGEIVDGATIDRRGLVARLVDDGDADAVANDLATTIAGSSPDVLALSVRTMRRLAEPGWEEALAEAERVYLEDLTRLPDMDEGIAAYMEKRTPQWRRTMKSTETDSTEAESTEAKSTEAKSTEAKSTEAKSTEAGGSA